MRALLCIISLVSLNACLLAAGESDDLDVASTEQALQTCTATCDYPVYNGVPVSCSSSIYCVAHANGVYCDTGGTPITKSCSACGNGSCQAGETPSSCPSDCGCGNGFCDSGETVYSCPGDCNECGDGFCGLDEEWCFEDCGPYCGDGMCSISERSWCAEDCGYQCLQRQCPALP